MERLAKIPISQNASGAVKIVRALYLVAWALLLVWFAARDAPNLFYGVRSNPAIAPSPDASMNYFLEALLAVSTPVDRATRS
jgi:hypothetical protein